MNIQKMKMAGVFGIILGIVSIIIAIQWFNDTTTSNLYGFILLLLGVINAGLNISIAIDASKRRK